MVEGKMMTLKAKSLMVSSILVGVLICILFVMISEVSSQNTQIRIIPSFIEVMEDGEEITIVCVVEDVLGLKGADIQISWNTIYLDYINHTATVPVEDFPHIPQSPYGGILHTTTFMVKDEVDVVGGTYWFAFAGFGDTLIFSGNGTAFVIAFQSKNVSLGDPSNYIDTYIEITSSDLADSLGDPINHNKVNGVVRIPEFHQLILPIVLMSTLMVILIKKKTRSRYGEE